MPVLGRRPGVQRDEIGLGQQVVERDQLDPGRAGGGRVAAVGLAEIGAGSKAGSKARTRKPSARALVATSRPTCPSPTSPRVRLGASRPMNSLPS